MIDELEIELQETTDELEVEDIQSGDYLPLTNKPKINNVELIGNKTSSDLGLVDEATLDDYYTSEEVDDLLDDKQDTINDLSTIRSGASLGATAVQPSAISDMATKTWVGLQGFITNAVNNLVNYFTKTEVNTLLGNKADKSDTYTKAQTDSAIANHHDSTKVDKVSGKGLSTNDYTNEDKLKVQSAIDKMVNDLVNYYTKSQTYNKNEVDTLISAIKQFTYEVVDVLPTASASTMNKIYLVPSQTSTTQNVKDEFITINNSGVYSWEQIGSTAIDLSNYYTKGQTDNLLSGKVDTSTLANYSTTSQMNTAIEGHHDSTKQDVISDLSTIRSGASLGATALQSVPNTYRTSAEQDVIDNDKVDKVNGKGLSENDFTTTLKDKLDGISANAKNVSVSATGTSTDEVQYITIDGTEKKLAGGGSGAVRYDEAQSLTDSQKAQARSNIGASPRIVKTTMDSVANVDTQYYLGEQSSVSFTLPSATAGQSVSVVFYSGATATTLSISGTMLGTIPTPQANQRVELNILYDNNYWSLLSNSMAVS